MPRSIILRSLARQGPAQVKDVQSWVHCRRSSQLGHPDRILAASRQHNDEEVIFQYDVWRQGSASIQAGRPVVGKLEHAAVLSACERLSLWSKAAAILQDAALRGALQPDSRPLVDLVSFNLVLGAYAAAHQWAAALDLFIDMQRTVTPDASSYAALIEGCRSARKHHIERIASKWSKQCFEETVSKINERKTSSRYCYLSLRTLVKRQLWSEAADLLWQLARAGRALDTELLNTAISAYARGQQARTALTLLRKAQAQARPLPALPALPAANLESFKLAALSFPPPPASFTKSGLPWPEALILLEDISRSRLQPDMQTFTIVAGVCSRAHSWHAALKVLEAARHHSLEWDIFAYRAVLQALSRHSVESDMNFRTVWRQLHHQQLSPDTITFGAAIALCDRSHKWADALHLLGEMQHPTAVCLTSALSACARGSAWELAVHLFWTMPGQWGFRPHAANMVNALHALGKALRWQQACALLFELEWADEHISWQHYFAVADSCGEASEWQKALQLVFEKLPGKFEFPPSYRFSAAIGACKSGLVFLEASGKSAAEVRSSSIWETALALFWSFEETLLPESEAGFSQAWHSIA